MPRIDPLQLLRCLSVLLNEDGGILSRTEVSRLVVLMTKFSKKLVSKCVYVLILKQTEPDLIDLFMGEGGWNLIQTWLQDAIHINNWDLVKEILSLLVITPVDVERLKLNNIPKLVKSLSKRDEVEGVPELATELVNNWLEIVKNSSQIATESKPTEIIVERQTPTTHDVTAATLAHMVNTSTPLPVITTESPKIIVTSSSASGSSGGSTSPLTDGIRPTTFYKISLNKDGKQVISKLGSSLNSAVVAETEVDGVTEEVNGAAEVVVKEEKKSDKEKDRSKDRRNSSSSSSKSRSSSSRDKDRKKSSSSSSKSSSSSSRDKDRDRDRKDKDKDKSRHNGSHSSSSSSSRSRKDRDGNKDKEKEKEKQAEKDKDTLAKLKPQTLDRIGRIPKKSDKPDKDKEKSEKSDKDKDKEKSEIKRKSTMSIEPRKKGEDRPKTVKVFNSKMRSTGLEEEVKPPPPRPTKKPSVQLPTIPTKRPSPIRDIPASQQPPEKKLKTDIPIIDRPGAIKLIPPKPKPAALQESDMFMDALCASATTKKEPKKRKRKLSKEATPTSPSEEKQQPTTPTSPTISGLKNIAPINFYQDTLSEDNNNSDSKEEEDERSVTPTDNTPEVEDTPRSPKIQKTEGLKGVLLHSKKKGPKRSISWRSEADLVEVRYFELDETERVNVTKTFMDMAKMEMNSEREALEMSRKLPSEDMMEPQTMWRFPYIIDLPEPLAVPGSKSLEKDIQYAREKSVLQALYFDKRKIPDSPEEPIPENYAITDAVNIPLEDADSQEIDLRNTPWPEPKGSPPHLEPPPVQFPISQFNSFSSIPPPNFVPPPRFAPHFNPNMINGMPPPNMGQPDLMNPMFRGPVPEGNFNMPVFNQPNMFPPNNFMRGGPPGGNNRGGFRPRMPPPGNWVRMNGPGPGMPPNWNRGMPPNRGGGMAGGGNSRMLCKNVKNHGFCRNRDNCPFMHPPT